jgi:hypothetical protein
MFLYPNQTEKARKRYISSNAFVSASVFSCFCASAFMFLRPYYAYQRYRGDQTLCWPPSVSIGYTADIYIQKKTLRTYVAAISSTCDEVIFAFAGPIAGYKHAGYLPLGAICKQL